MTSSSKAVTSQKNLKLGIEEFHFSSTRAEELQGKGPTRGKSKTGTGSLKDVKDDKTIWETGEKIKKGLNGKYGKKEYSKKKNVKAVAMFKTPSGYSEVRKALVSMGETLNVWTLEETRGKERDHDPVGVVRHKGNGEDGLAP